MKKLLSLAVLSALFLFSSCEKPIENDLAGHSFVCDFGTGSSTGLDFFSDSYRVDKWFIMKGEIHRYINYYTYEGNIVKVYLDEECTDLLLTGVFIGDRIIVDGNEDFPYIMRW